MKNLVTIIFILASLYLHGQTLTDKIDLNRWKAPYSLEIPHGWTIERFLIPIEFAPQIPYKGIEDIRFTPGWGSSKSNEYWTYAFLWYLDGTPKINLKNIKANLKAYDSGLVDRNITPRKIPSGKLITVEVKAQKEKKQKGDLRTFAGTIYMLDYMEQKPIVLNFTVHIKINASQNKTFLFTEISPRPHTDNVWRKLDQLWLDFTYELV